jgi:hypothetical protein
MATVKPGDRARTGFKKGSAKGKYPMATQAQCVSAVKLRHHGKGVSASAVLSKASAVASRNNWSSCKAAIRRARVADSSRKSGS